MLFQAKLNALMSLTVIVFGQVTEEQAGRIYADWVSRAEEEMTWVGTIFYWFFTRRTIEESNQSFYYFRMAEADYKP